MKRSYLVLSLAALILSGAAGCSGDDIPPGRASDLTYFDHSAAVIFKGHVAVGPSSGPTDTRLLAWTTAGDDGRQGSASQFDVRYVRQRDLDRWGLTDGREAFSSHWSEAHQLVGEPQPDDPKEFGQIFLPRVFSAEDVWFALRTMDETGQSSKTSNVVGPIRVAPVLMPVRSSAGATPAGFGTVVHWAGDSNGDGYPDVILGSPDLGRVTIHLGGATSKLVERVPNLNGVRVKRALTERLPRMNIIGDPAAEFGYAVSGLARVTADRSFEFAAGAPGLDNGATLDAGAVYIFHGKRNLPEVLSADSAATIIHGAVPGARLGSSLSAAALVAGDDTLNFMAGAPAADGRGYVYIFRAGIKDPATDADAIVVLQGAAAGDEFGAEVEVIGDVNSDGVPDLAVGAPGAFAGAGAVYVFYGGDAGVIDFPEISGQRVIDLSATDADVTIQGTVAGRRFGQSITVGGDLAGNDTPAKDFAVGGVDIAYVFFGGAVDTTTPFTGSGLTYNDTAAAARLSGPAGSGFGQVVIGPGDLNRDNADDLAVAVPGLEQVWIFSGPIATGAAPDEIVSAPASGVGFASGLASPGDINLDGFPDLVISAPGAGQAWLLF